MANNEPKASPNQPRKRQDALGNKLPDPQEELALIDKELGELKIVFEQYFMGMERQSPVRRRDALGEKLRKLKSSGVIRNTALKFRLEQAWSKFQTYDRMWTRTLTEIENGTYRRDVFKMKHRQSAQAKPAGDAAAPRAAGKSEPEKGPPTESALTDGQLRALYDTYVIARQRTNESLAGITYDSLSSSIRKQVPELLRKHDCRAIDFKVVIKGGKAMLKAVPRK